MTHLEAPLVRALDARWLLPLPRRLLRALWVRKPLERLDEKLERRLRVRVRAVLVRVHLAAQLEVRFLPLRRRRFRRHDVASQ